MTDWKLAEREALRWGVAEAIRRRRLKLGLTQSALARRVETERPLVARVENARHELTIGTLYRYAEGLSTTPSALLRTAERLARRRAERLTRLRAAAVPSLAS